MFMNHRSDIGEIHTIRGKGIGNNPEQKAGTLILFFTNTSPEAENAAPRSFHHTT